ncbi:hypothetical protein ACHHYP_03646 [Achlya hypogyna]|uniref:Uncharacterized protein n=1 Tax=Achlya hypogyna TaxID=1202772 RepID=A0A1V9Z3A8_ACHHY|nr:hypothetical protein ACHHYP_03646 [Achlya hypogyna]
MTDEARELAKWKRRIDENRYIRQQGLLSQANLLAYAMQKLAHQTPAVGLADKYYIWGLLKQGYSVNERDDTGVPPLVHAATRGWYFFVHLFLSYDGDINYTSTIQESAVCAACRRQRSGLVRYLAHRGADLNICDKSGFSCLRWACKHQDVGLLQILLSYGASVSKDCGTSQRSALDWACECENHAMVALLERALVKEKQATLADLQNRKRQAGLLKRLLRKTVQEPPIEPTEKSTESDAEALSVRHRRAQARREQQQLARIQAHEQHAKAAFEARAATVMKTLRPKEIPPVVIAVETEWRKVKPMKWSQCPVPRKVDAQAQVLVDLKRIQDIARAATDDFDMATPRLKKSPSLGFYCPEEQW